MVKIHIKNNDQSQFIYETTIKIHIDDLILQLSSIYNGRLKIQRICAEMEELAQHGTLYPPEILGLTPEQVDELKLVDTWGDKCVPIGGFTMNPDSIGRRNGKKPTTEMGEILLKAVKDAKEMIDKKLVTTDQCLTLKIVEEALNLLKGAVMIVYPMKLPPHDIIRMEFENIEDLTGTQASLDVIDPTTAQLWFCGKELYRTENKILADYVGTNDKCKVVMKLTKRGSGAPAREPILTEDERKEWMMKVYRKQEEWKKLEADDDDNYLNSAWADGGSLKRSFHGLSQISWRPGK